MFVAFMLYVLCQQFCSFHHLLCFPDAAMSDALYSDMDALRHQNCLHGDMEALAKDYGLLDEELADHKGILRLCQVCCVCVSAVVAAFMCMCLLLYVSFSAYVSGCYSRSSSSSHTAIGGITQPFVPNLLPDIDITAIDLASVPADMMHQISLCAMGMGMHLQSSSDEDGEDEADEMQDDEMMKVICKLRRLRKTHKALKQRLKFVINAGKCPQTSSLLETQVPSVEEFQGKTKET